LQTLAEVHQQQLKAHLQPQGHRDTSSKEKTLEKFCRKLTESIEGEKASASFACGGTVGIEEAEANAEKLAKPASSPVNIFWALQRDSNARKLVLPLSNTDDSNPEVLQQLVGDCSPATFGRGKKDVLDPKYRKAGKMDVTQFATNFDLPKFGILENVEQILLPSIGADRESDFYFRKLRAELYKLNVRGCCVSNIYCVLTHLKRYTQAHLACFASMSTRHVQPNGQHFTAIASMRSKGSRKGTALRSPTIYILPSQLAAHSCQTLSSTLRPSRFMGI
jgi:hypothetical protein